MLFTQNKLLYFFQLLIVLVSVQISPSALLAQSPDFASIKIDLDSKPNIGSEIEKSIQYLFSMLKKKNRNIEITKLDALLTMAVNPTIHSGDISLRDRGGKGAFLRETVKAPIETMVSYYFDNTMPLSAIQPAGLRASTRLKGTEKVPPQVVPLFLNGALASPSVFFSSEEEETSPDMFTGAVYRYTTQKIGILFPKYKGKRIALLANNQPDKSSISEKSVILGDDQDWNYIYSTLLGGTDPATGWVKSHIYDSSMIFIIVENEDSSTEIFLFKWLRAGWLRINVVTSSHIYRGSKRVLYSINKVFSSPKLPSKEILGGKYQSLQVLSTEELRAQLAPYAKKLSIVAPKNPILKEDEWKPFVGNAKYPSTLNRTQMINLLIKNFMKEQIGVPIL